MTNELVAVLMTLIIAVAVVLVVLMILRTQRQDVDAVLHIDLANEDEEFFKLELLSGIEEIKRKTNLNVKVDMKE